MRILIAMLPLALAAGALPAAAKTESDAVRIDKALAGLTPGKPVSCVSQRRLGNSTQFGSGTILYRESSRLTWRNDLPGGCSVLGNLGAVVVTRTTMASICEGEILRIRDLVGGIDFGTCTLGKFVPYTR